ncbi:MAG: hypothetical protein BJ554DRAFT_4922, partial [Olpidium bornovanus]
VPCFGRTGAVVRARRAVRRGRLGSHAGRHLRRRRRSGLPEHWRRPSGPGRRGGVDRKGYARRPVSPTALFCGIPDRRHLHSGSQRAGGHGRDRNRDQRDDRRRLHALHPCDYQGKSGGHHRVYVGGQKQPLGHRVRRSGLVHKERLAERVRLRRQSPRNEVEAADSGRRKGAQVFLLQSRDALRGWCFFFFFGPCFFGLFLFVLDDRPARRRQSKSRRSATVCGDPARGNALPQVFTPEFATFGPR